MSEALKDWVITISSHLVEAFGGMLNTGSGETGNTFTVDNIVFDVHIVC